MSNEKNTLRLNKFLAQWGGLSRRKADEIIKRGQVFVNGKKISQLAVFVDPKKDLVKIKRQVIHSKNDPKHCFMFNKPPKVLTTAHDPKGRPTVMDYIKSPKERLFSVGRLDWDSEGLLILTNDGDLANNILHPKNQIPKTYLVKISGRPNGAQIRKLVQGVSTSVGKRKALFAERVFKKTSSNSWVKLIISEGKKRQIRLMFEKIGFPVLLLRRTAIGRLKMNKLAKSSFVKLTEKDIKKIFQRPKEIESSFLRKKNK